MTEPDAWSSQGKTQNETIKLYGLKFEGTKSEYYGTNAQCYVSDCNLDVERCTFEGGMNGMSIIKANVTITDCTFNKNSSAFWRTVGNVTINSSTFSENGYLGITPQQNYFMTSNDDNVKRTINISNCTFFKNKKLNISGKANSEINFTNNTIAMSDTIITIDTYGSLKFTGNIIYANKLSLDEKDNQTITSQYNVYCIKNYVGTKFTAKTDLEVSSCPFLSTELKDNGGYGFTKTLALLYDETSDGKTLRFPRTVSGLVGDQRNMLRAENTNMGAFEKNATKRAPKYRTALADTIRANYTYFVDGKYYPIGKNTIIKKLKDVNGDDSLIITHTLYVWPDLSTLNYYVTKKGRGDRSGKSWENAMNDTSFAYAVCKVPNGTTFHIAEGTYHPMYDNTGKVPDNVQNCVFYTRNLINFVGGYSEKDPNSDPSPDKYPTILSGDLKDDNNGDISKNLDDNVYNVLLYKLSRSGDVSISGIYFNISSITKAGSDGLLRFDVDDTYTITANVSLCEFAYASRNIYATNSVLTINECRFLTSKDYTSSSYISTPQGKRTSIEKSSCFNSNFTLNGFDFSLKNNTLYNVSIDRPWGSELFTKGELYSNTITSTSFLNNGEYTIIGNIFFDKVFYSGNNSVNSSYNIYNESNQEEIASYSRSSDLILTGDDYKSILHNNGSSFKILYNGGFTSTIAITKDTLPNGQTIRFPLKETVCETDQRGVNRLVYTCRGAFEATCKKTEIYASKIDTLSIDAYYYDNTFKDTGLHTKIEQKEKNICGEDSIIYHNVMVMPSIKKNVYYVKQEKAGTGDGMSWENAMSDSMFAYVLANLKSNATFHIAEGTYTPVYNSEKKLNAYVRDRFFYTKQSIKIYGGYDKNITDESDKPNPSKYKTIFSGDTKGAGDQDDYTYEILQISPSSDGESEVYGITFCNNVGNRYSGEALLLLSPSSNDVKASISVSECSFRNATHGFAISNASAHVSNCTFQKNTNSFGRYYNNGSIHITACMFENNSTNTFYVSDSIIITNSTVIGGNLSLRTDNLALYNNTLLADSVEIQEGTTEAKIIGNIVEKLVCDESVAKTCKHNLMHEKVEGNIYSSDFADILPYDNGKKSYLLTSEDGLTNAVKIESSTLPDGTSLKFPIEETIVETDQWGRDRLTNTCIGSLEGIGLDCEPVEITLEEVDTIPVGSSYREETYTKTGEYDIVEHLTSESGCDSTVHHPLIVFCQAVETLLDTKDSIVVGDTYLDTLYTETGEFKAAEHLKNQWGCDSIVHHTLVVYCQTKDTLLEEVDSILVGTSYRDSIYFETGTYNVKEELKTQWGCDSIVYHPLEVYCINKEVTIEEIDTIKVESYYLDSIYNEAGTYEVTEHLTTLGGCDSIVHHTLFVSDELDCENIELTIEDIDTISIGTVYLDSLYLTPGEYDVVNRFKTKEGCDSIVHHSLLVICKDVEVTLETVDSILAGSVYRDSIYFETGSYNVKEELNTQWGCDSIVYHPLVVYCTSKEMTIEEIDTIKVESYYLDSIYSEVGTFEVTEYLSTLGGCDSIVHHTLVVSDELDCENIELTIEGIDTITVGTVYHDSLYLTIGEYDIVRRYKLEKGCDSIVHRHLFVEKVSTCEPVFTSLDPVTITVGESFLDSTYSQPGKFVIEEILQKTDGCDSIIQHYLYVIEELCEPVYTQLDDVSIVIGGSYKDSTYWEAGEFDFEEILQKADGCDSIIQHHLIVAPCKDVTQKIKKADTIYVGTNYMDSTYYLPGKYEVYETSVTDLGCDSITIHKLIVLSDNGVDDIQAPGFFNSSEELFMPNHEVFIYNLQGSLICHSLDGWDGTIQGRKAPIGIYIYAIVTDSGLVKRGVVELIQSR